MISKKQDSIEKTERLQVMGELSARVAHELRNPLGVIKNAVELIEIDFNNYQDEKLQKRIIMIKNATDRMLRQVLKISKL
jgi:signal transduction histidine kinase